jgi:hypothetical protein
MNKIRRLPLVILLGFVPTFAGPKTLCRNERQKKADLAINTADAQLQVGKATEIEDMRAARRASSTRRSLRIVGSE